MNWNHMAEVSWRMNMKKRHYLFLVAVLLVPTAPLSAQTNSLIVDENGSVGIVVVSPLESVLVTAGLQPPFVDLPSRCERDLPVRIVIVGADSGNLLMDERQVLSETSRTVFAELPPSFRSDYTRVQIGVLTRPRLKPCIAVDFSAVTKRITDTDGDLDEIIAIRRLGP